MKSGFKDPIAIKNQRPKDRTEKQNRKTWNFECPQYDERSSCFVNAGTHYGVGHKSPVGRKGNPVDRASTLPFGRANTMETDDVG